MFADTYVWSDAQDPDLYGEWDFEVRVSCSMSIRDVSSPQLKMILF
jgi:hypothetical protein